VILAAQTLAASQWRASTSRPGSRRVHGSWMPGPEERRMVSMTEATQRDGRFGVADDHDARIRGGSTMSDARTWEENGIVTKISPRSVADTVTLFSSTVRAKGMKLFAVISTSVPRRAKSVSTSRDHARRLRQSRRRYAVMVASPLSALDLPLKVLAGPTGIRRRSPTSRRRPSPPRHNLSPDLRFAARRHPRLTDAGVRADTSG